MTEKKKYEKPSQRVIELQQQSIICTSPGQAGVQDYNWNNVDEE